MAHPWYTHDAGLFRLELPHGWVAEHPNTGTLLLMDPDRQLGVSLLAIARVPLGSVKRPVTGAEAQQELHKWMETQRQVRMHQPPRIVAGHGSGAGGTGGAGGGHAIATTEGLQVPSARLSWWRRLILRARGAHAGRTLWRFWAILNPHLLVLVSCNGTPATLEKHRAQLDRLVASVTLPERELLVGRRFTETVISLARSWFPQMAVTLIDDGHMQFGSQPVSLAGLHRRYLASPEELPTQVRAFLAAVQVSMPASALAGNWRHAGPRVMPVFLTPRMLGPEQKHHVVHEDWINGLSIGYALEDAPPRPPRRHVKFDDAADATTEPSQRIIMHEDLMRWKISAEDLHDQAMQNLVIYSHEHIMEGRREDGLTLLCLASPDRHNAARILLPELHQKLREHLGRTFLAAMPAREVLVAFNIADEKLLQQMRSHVAEDFANAPHPLSPKFFLVTPDGIAGDPADPDPDTPGFLDL